MIKNIYDRKTKEDKFNIGDVVVCWDEWNEEKGNHDKFKKLWKGPYKISAFRGKNAYVLEEMNGQSYLGGEINGRLLKHYYI